MVRAVAISATDGLRRHLPSARHSRPDHGARRAAQARPAMKRARRADRQPHPIVDDIYYSIHPVAVSNRMRSDPRSGRVRAEEHSLRLLELVLEDGDERLRTLGKAWGQAQLIAGACCLLPETSRRCFVVASDADRDRRGASLWTVRLKLTHVHLRLRPPHSPKSAHGPRLGALIGLGPLATFGALAIVVAGVQRLGDLSSDGQGSALESVSLSGIDPDQQAPRGGGPGRGAAKRNRRGCEHEAVSSPAAADLGRDWRSG